MNDKQKQIEEMAYSICTANRKLIKSCRECPIFHGYKYPCVKKEFAEKFYNAGCRMQSDTAREILQYLYEKMGNVSLSDAEFVLYLATQYGVEVKE